MTTIDEIGRRAALDALADGDAHADVEDGLARIRDGDEGEAIDRSSARRWAMVAAAATVVGAVAAGITLAGGEPSTPVAPAVTPAPTVAPTTVGPTTPATAAPTAPTSPATNQVPSTTTAPVPPEDGLGVSYLAPPPLLTPDPFVALEVSERATVAVSPSGGAVVLDPTAGTVVVAELDGSKRTVALDVAPDFLVGAGPGDVVYGVNFVEPDVCCMPEVWIVAIALSGEREGQVVASAQKGDINRFNEIPLGAFGNGPTGIVDRAALVGEQVIGYVGTAGQPAEWPSPPPALVTIDGDNVVRSTAGQEWPLSIERHPDWLGESYVGESPPSPAPGGGAVLWTSIGPPLGTDTDFPPPTVPVVALLAPDGTATWRQIPDGWAVAASDVGGAILARRDGGQLQLAALSAGGSAAPNPVAALAEEIGASRLVVRGPGLVTSVIDGVTTEAAIPADVYPLSDGELLWWATVGADGQVRSTAATLDGTVICDVAGSIHRVRVEPDGGYVASVEESIQVEPFVPDQPIPNFAVDCETGERQPIEPISVSLEGGSRFVVREGERRFDGTGDAEGNADIVNEAGASINGDDYAGYHTFDADGSRVAYLVMDTIATPHLSTAVRARDTTSGELLWSLELDRPAAPVWWYGDRVLAVIPAADGTLATEAVVVIDAATGTVVETVPTTLDIAFIG